MPYAKPRRIKRDRIAELLDAAALVGERAAKAAESPEDWVGEEIDLNPGELAREAAHFALKALKLRGGK